MESSTPAAQTQTHVTMAYTPANEGLRLVNYLVDLMLSFFTSIIGMMTVMVLSIALKKEVDAVEKYLLFGGSFIMCRFLYYFLSEKFLGRTPAKFLTKTQVIDDDGGRSALRIAGRTVARIIPLDEFSIFFNKHRCWHDSLSNTWVVKSSDLPAEKRLGKKTDVILTVLTCILLAMPLGLFAAWPIYEEFTGGKRIDIPAQMPADLRLVKLETKRLHDNSYFSFVYEGQNRTIRMNQLIAGHEFDPDNPCGSMQPVETIAFVKTKTPGYECKEIYRNPNKRIVAVIKQRQVGEHMGANLQYDLADYYITDPPYRLLLKADKGSLTDEEVIAMAASGLVTKKEDELKSSL